MNVNKLILLVTFLIIGCDEESIEVSCGKNFITSHVKYRPKTGFNYYYNTDSLIYKIEGNDEVVILTYDGFGNLKTAIGESVGSINFYYDNNVLLYAHRWNPTFDSIAFQFDTQKQLIKSSFFETVVDFEGNATFPMTRFHEFYYSNGNVRQEKIFRPNPNMYPEFELVATADHEYDNNPTPFPKSIDPYFYYINGQSASENNIISSAWIETNTLNSGTTNHSYSYNIDGYPVKHKIGSTLIDEFVYACEPKIK